CVCVEYLPVPIEAPRFAAWRPDGDTLGVARCSLGFIVKRPFDIGGKAQGCFHFLRGAASRSERGILPAPIVDDPCDDVAAVDAGVVEDVPADIGIVVGSFQVVRLQEGIERGVTISSGRARGHGVVPLSCVCIWCAWFCLVPIFFCDVGTSPASLPVSVCTHMLPNV